MNSLALALNFAAFLAYLERDSAEVGRFASELIEISTRHNFVYWLATGQISRGRARSASGDTAKGISWIEQGIKRSSGNRYGAGLARSSRTQGRSLTSSGSYL
jgi:hypothetical protein